MFKTYYIRKNLNLYNEIEILLFELSDLSVTDNLTVHDIRLRINADYKEYISLHTKKWLAIREDNVLLIALRDELKRLKQIGQVNKKCG